MTDAKYNLKHLQDNTIYMSYSEKSFPHQIYMEMREKFWQYHLKVCKENEMNYNMYSDNESNNNPPSVSDTDIPRTATTKDSSKKVVHQKSAQIIPMSMDIATQFNSDMKIIVKQDSNDSAIVNIKFGGPIHGNVEGTGHMPRNKFHSLMTNAIRDTVGQISAQSMTQNDDNVETGSTTQTTISMTKPTDKLNLRTEESLHYFASTLPGEPVVKKQNEKSSGQKTNLSMATPEIVSNKKLQNEQLKSNSEQNGATAVFVQHFGTSQLAEVANIPAISKAYNNGPVTDAPAILPKCIIRRISLAMVNDLATKKKATVTVFDLEKKIALLALDDITKNKNWHAAIKRGRLMVAEIIELIVTVNIDKTSITLDEIKAISVDLKSELINSSFYLLSLTERNNNDEVLCLKLIIDIISDEINKLMMLTEKWIATGSKPDLSSFFHTQFMLSISPLNSIASDNVSKSTESSVTEKSSTTIAKSSKNTLPDKRTMTLDKQQKDKGRNIEDFKTIAEEQFIHPDPSIITNSRVKKSMNAILQSAVDDQLSFVNLSKTHRNDALRIEIINKKPLMIRDNNTSLIVELVQQDARWNEPVSAGKLSVQDLIEFIINTTAQDKELMQDTYNEIVKELNQLEKELIFSLTNNLYTSRHSDKDLMSLSYEILAEIIIEQVAMAKYIFNSLDHETISSKPYPLGKLYRKYISQQTNSPRAVNMKTYDNYAHQSSEVKNYNDTSGTFNDQKQRTWTETSQPTAFESKDQETKEQKKQKSVNPSLIKSPDSQTQLTNDAKSYENIRSINLSKTDRSRTDSKKSQSSEKPKETTSDYESHYLSTEEKKDFTLIIEKLNNQSKEIHKIRENLQSLTGKVDSNFSKWTCNFSIDKVNEYCSDRVVNFAETTKIYNTQEFIRPGEITSAIVQPSVYKPVAEMHSKALKFESKSYVAPIANETEEQQIGHVNSDIEIPSNFTANDILKLINEGSFNFLNKTNKSQNDERRDSCIEMNAEFDKIFQWIVDKYYENLNNLRQTPEGLQFLKMMDSLLVEERLKIERELVDKIVEENNITINNWLKEICYKRLLNCLTSTTSR